MSALNKFLFRSSVVFAEFDLLNADGSPCVIPESADTELMALPYVDNYSEGFGLNPAQVIFSFKHPRELHPANLLNMQEEVASIIERHKEIEAEVRIRDQANLPLSH